jgi:hypothetical protein
MWSRLAAAQAASRLTRSGCGGTYRPVRGLPSGMCSQCPAPLRTTASASRFASSPARIPVRAGSSTTSRSRGPALARAAAITFAAPRSPGNFGSGPGFWGMSQAMTGLRGGAPGQSHSMIRSKNWRMARIGCRCVSAVIVPRPARGRAASHTLKSSMSSRPMSATAARPASVITQRASWRSALPAASTLAGARNVPSCRR